MFKVIDNFLDKESFVKLQYEVLLSRNFPWYFQDMKDLEYVDKKNVNDLNQFQFTHVLYAENKPTSEWFILMQPLLKKLKVKSLIRIKANLIPYSPKLYEGYYHTDNPFSCLSAIYYINNNNGYTHFEKNNKKVNSKENRIVMFDSKLKHRGTNTTDQKKRIVLNINYF
tara:strand:+ start:176 stop:682 length:507 start_codon:yes stop_codon:yes gene_type:complete